MEQFVAFGNGAAGGDIEQSGSLLAYNKDDIFGPPESMDMLNPSHRSEVVDFARGISEISSGLQDIMAYARAAERLFDAMRRSQSRQQPENGERTDIADLMSDIISTTRAVNAELNAAVRLKSEASNVLKYTEPISVPFVVERVAQTMASRLEGRLVEVVPLIRLPKLHHSITTVRLIFQQAVFAMANEAATCVAKATTRSKLTLVADTAVRIGRGDRRYILIRALTAGVKVSPETLEKLFLKSTSSSLALNDMANQVRRLGGDLGASTDGSRAEFWVAMPEDTNIATPPTTPTPTPPTATPTPEILSHGSAGDAVGPEWRRRSWDVYDRAASGSAGTNCPPVHRSSSDEDVGTKSRTPKARLSLENTALVNMSEIFEAASKEQSNVDADDRAARESDQHGSSPQNISPVGSGSSSRSSGGDFSMDDEVLTSLSEKLKASRSSFSNDEESGEQQQRHNSIQDPHLDPVSVACDGCHTKSGVDPVAATQASSSGLAAFVLAHTKASTTDSSGSSRGSTLTKTDVLPGEGVSPGSGSPHQAPSPSGSTTDAPAGGLTALLRAHGHTPPASSPSSTSSPSAISSLTAGGAADALTPVPSAAPAVGGLAALLQAHGKAQSAGVTYSGVGQGGDAVVDAALPTDSMKETTTAPNIFAPQGGPPPTIVPFSLTPLPATTDDSVDGQNNASPTSSPTRGKQRLVRTAAVGHDDASVAGSPPTTTATTAAAAAPLAASAAPEFCFIPTAPPPQILTFSIGAPASNPCTPQLSEHTVPSTPVDGGSEQAPPESPTAVPPSDIADGVGGVRNRRRSSDDGYSTMSKKFEFDLGDNSGAPLQKSPGAGMSQTLGRIQGKSPRAEKVFERAMSDSATSLLQISEVSGCIQDGASRVARAPEPGRYPDPSSTATPPPRGGAASSASPEAYRRRNDASGPRTTATLQRSGHGQKWQQQILTHSHEKVHTIPRSRQHAGSADGGKHLRKVSSLGNPAASERTDRGDTAGGQLTGRHGRNNIEHALKALQELGLDPNAWGDMKTSARVVECRPHTDEFQRDQKVVVCHEDYKKILKYSLHKARALLVLPNMGTVATVSEYLSQWQVLHDAAPDFKDGTARVKKRNQLLAAENNGKKAAPAVSVIFMDIDGSIDNHSRRIPENMLSRRHMRFVFICSRKQWEVFSSRPETQWFAKTPDCHVILKPISRQDVWQAMTDRKSKRSGPAVSPAPTLVTSRRLMGAPVQGSPLGSPKMKRKQKPPGSTGAKILLAEDNMTNVLVAENYLKILGHTAVFAVNGEDCVEEYKRNMAGPREGRYQLIFMDCVMPIMDGFAASQRIRQLEKLNGRTQPIPIVAMTGFTLPQELEKCKEVGMTDHLAKPFSMADFAGKIDAHLAPTTSPASPPSGAE
eukprot:m.1107292 g.1107292  ORF g.1107292 m.1107292 type:complete len:1391 (+) comp24348_c0_seq6:149-4321(+)